MFLRFFYKSILCSVFFLPSQLLAMDCSESREWGPQNSIYVSQQAIAQERFEHIRSEKKQTTTPKQAGPFSSTYDPEYICSEIDKHKFSSIEWKKVTKSKDTKLTRVSMDKFEWKELGSDDIMYTDKLKDCIGIALIEPKLGGLGHISSTGRNILKEELEKIKNPKDYTIFLTSLYYSTHLDAVYSIIKEKFPTSPIYADIANNYMLHDPEENTKTIWDVQHKWFYPYEDERYMQLENMRSLTMCIDLKTGHLGRTLPQN